MFDEYYIKAQCTFSERLSFLTTSDKTINCYVNLDILTLLTKL